MNFQELEKMYKSIKNSPKCKKLKYRSAKSVLINLKMQNQKQRKMILNCVSCVEQNIWKVKILVGSAERIGVHMAENFGGVVENVGSIRKVVN